MQPDVVVKMCYDRLSGAVGVCSAAVEDYIDRHRKVCVWVKSLVSFNRVGSGD